jgi:uncharacterized repeat protein (TIGR01451 family)
MSVRHVLILCVLALTLAVSAGVATASANLTGTLEAYRVVVNDKGVESFLPADNARPKDVIEYRLTYSNAGDEPIQQILITDPVPIGTQLLNPAAAQPKNARAEFSIDGGKNYQQWPIMVKKTDGNGDEKLVEATPDMVTHIRWTLTEAIRAKGNVTLTYRTVIK